MVLLWEGGSDGGGGVVYVRVGGVGGGVYN